MAFWSSGGDRARNVTHSDVLYESHEGMVQRSLSSILLARGKRKKTSETNEVPAKEKREKEEKKKKKRRKRKNHFPHCCCCES